MSVLVHAAEVAPIDRTVARALGVVMGSAGLHDPAAAEEILVGLARRLDRPLYAVAADLVSGRDFSGRPSWL